MSETQINRREQLQSVLERFGSDQKSWPSDARAPLQAYLEENPEAQQLYREFVALDRLLARDKAQAESAPLPNHDALAARIMDGITSTQAPTNEDRVVHLQDHRRQRRSSSPLDASWTQAVTAGALAASLLLGISVGSTGALDDALAPVAEVIGLSSGDATTVALSDQIFEDLDAVTFEEDLL